MPPTYSDELLKRRMLKGPPLIPRTLKLSNLRCKFRSDLPKSEICNIWGVQYVQKIRSTEIGPRIVLKLKNTSRPEDRLKTKKYQ